MITGPGRKAALNPAFKWVNTTLGNIKSAITGTFRTIPDKLRATRTGGFASVEMVSDGKTLSLLGKNANVYLITHDPQPI